LKAFKPSVARSLSHDFATAVLILGGGKKPLSSNATIGALQQMHSQMSSDVLAPATAAKVGQCWRHIQDLQSHALIADIEVNVQRRMIMASHAAAFQWLHGVFDKAKNLDRETCWASRVICLLQDQILVSRSKKTSISLNGRDYSPDFPAKSASILYPRTINDQDTFVTQAFVTVIRKWFGFPAAQLAFYQAKFVTHLCLTFGDASLLHPAVFNAFTRLKPEVFCDTRITDSRMHDAFNTFTMELGNHATTGRSSTMRSMLDRLQSLFSDWERNLSEMLMPPQISSSGAPASSHGPINSIARDTAMERVLVFVRDAYQAINPNYKGAYNNLQQAIQKAPNFLLPQRELMPDRVHAKLTGNFFDLDQIHTRAGCFNVAMFRGLLFGAEACVQCHRFDGLNDWNGHQNSPEFAGQPDSFWCNKRAFGPPIAQRKKENAESFWAESANWPAWLKVNPEPTFDDLISFFKRFYSVSELVGFVMAVDMVYAGFGVMETPEEMGSRIYSLDKGARSGLVYLGLIGQESGREETIEAFCELYRYLESHLTPAEKHAMTFDVFMVENTLCKLQRVARLVQLW
jgi:hypothetical protein